MRPQFKFAVPPWGIDRPTGSPRKHFATGMISLAGMCLFVPACESPSGLAGRQGTSRQGSLSPFVRELDFGTLAAGSRRELAVEFHNPNDYVVQVTDVTTSCDCFQLIVVAESVPPHEKISAQAIVDLSHDREAAGCLRLEASGRCGLTGRKLFTIYGNVNVVGR
jgi:hypothetical protein